MSDGRSLVYLVTGGCGFLGRHLLGVTLEKEKRVREIRLFDKVVDPRLTEQSTDGVQVTVLQGDITDYPSVREAVRGADVVFHSASLVDVWHKVSPAVIHAVNVTGTENVIQACMELGVQYLVYTSSMEVVGPNVKGDPFIRGNEETPYNIAHAMPYPRSKAEAERIVVRANGTEVSGGKTLHTCSLRPTGIYGEEHQLMKDFYDKSVQAGGRLILGVPKNTEHGRVYAGNVAWMHLLAARGLMEEPQTVGGQAYFCYDDSPYKSYEDFNLQFLSAFGFSQVHVPLAALWFLAVLNDVLRWLLRPVCQWAPLLNRYTLAVACTSFTVSSDKARRHFRYTPLFSWEECRARTQAWVDTFPGLGAKKDS
ncbi:3 beta-hydroxysteroid dehydrogenase type 7 [Gadus chalcogrammus]|uniref:3 beta-hydroxysteroid dehydrogenase type 7 n=1 Tax=Gadus chalcogrammus TaxID=1042646 RepID=UPI0024C3DF2D|nr:3 beta-hydroxysteroid dehydrogenase type 7 [Gadus chalcogrammus]